jgi:hypothetical protein
MGLTTDGGLLFVDRSLRKFRTCVQNNTDLVSSLDDPRRAMDDCHYGNEGNNEQA